MYKTVYDGISNFCEAKIFITENQLQNQNDIIIIIIIIIPESTMLHKTGIPSTAQVVLKVLM
jgi:hypothetical protein